MNTASVMTSWIVSGTRRIVRRHAAVVFRDIPSARTRVEYSDSEMITAVELMTMLEPTLGFVTNLRFRPSLTGLPNTVSWEALDEHAEVVSGRLILHTAVAENEVASWADVVVDEVPF